jgi:acyl-CoA thioesterase
MSDLSTARLPQETAEFVRVGMFASDHASQWMGMRVTAIEPGRATMTMTVRPEMLNGVGSCQGGFIATLADSAFAYACNSYNERTVASGFDVDFLAPAMLGDQLEAHAFEVSRTGRIGLYDAHVVNQRGERIAVFRGRSYTIKGKPTVAAST